MSFYHRLEDVKTNSLIHKELLKIVGNHTDWRADEILFLENQSSLGDTAANNFRIWCVENKIKHNILYNIKKLPFEYLAESIKDASFIAFETTGTNEIVGKLRDYLLSLKDYPKKIIECYISEPVFMYLPKGAVHKMWSLHCVNNNMDKWELYKLSKSKGYYETQIVGRT